jgi:hypothetical protein
MICRPVAFEKIVSKISYANSELIPRNTRERALEMLKTITSDFCIEKNSEDKATVKAIHNRKQILVDVQVEKSKINNWWLVTMTPHL